jgi:hypothetical protein
MRRINNVFMRKGVERKLIFQHHLGRIFCFGVEKKGKVFIIKYAADKSQ